jgi:tetratricopeptide (TPR) repeat protein
MKRNLALCLAVVLGLPVTSGCGKAAQEIVAAALTEPVAKPALEAPSPEQVNGFVQALAEAAQKGDAKAVDALIDWTTLARRGCAGMRVTEPVLASFVEGARGAAVERGLPAQLASVAKGEARLHYLGAEQRGGETWQTFRFNPAEGGFEHMSFVLALDPAGKPRIVDFLPLTIGEAASEMVRRMVLPMIAVDPEAVLKRMGGRDAMFVANMKAVVELQKAAAEGRTKDAYEMYTRLPEELRKEKWLMIQRITLASSLGDSVYLAAIEDARRKLPNDPSMAVHMIDGNLLLKRYDDALAAIDVVAKTSIADPYFDVVRANILLEAGRLPEARTAVERAVASEPTLIDAHWLLVAVTLRQQDHAATSRVLLDMKEKFALAFDLENAADYAAYVKSKDYAKARAALAN